MDAHELIETDVGACREREHAIVARWAIDGTGVLEAAQGSGEARIAQDVYRRRFNTSVSKQLCKVG
jgi:hypothetical protein